MLRTIDHGQLCTLWKSEFLELRKIRHYQASLCYPIPETMSFHFMWLAGTSGWYVENNANIVHWSIKLAMSSPSFSFSTFGKSKQGRGSPLPWQLHTLGFDIENVNAVTIHTDKSPCHCSWFLHMWICTCVQGLTHQEFSCLSWPFIY
jgi:hypothetical protein